MTPKRNPFGTLDRILLVYSFGAALGVVLFVFVFKALDLRTDIPLFLVPTALGFFLIERAFRAGARQRDGKSS